MAFLFCVSHILKLAMTGSGYGQSLGLAHRRSSLRSRAETESGCPSCRHRESRNHGMLLGTRCCTELVPSLRFAEVNSYTEKALAILNCRAANISRVAVARHFGVASKTLIRINHLRVESRRRVVAPDFVGSLNGRGWTFAMQLASSPLVVPVRDNSCLIDR
jgi:hypothetical protein